MAYMYVPIATRSKAPQTSTWNNTGESNAVDTIVFSAGLVRRSYASHSIGDRQTTRDVNSHCPERLPVPNDKRQVVADTAVCLGHGLWAVNDRDS